MLILFFLSKKGFEVLWRLGFFNLLYEETDILIDEFETTIIDDMAQLSFLAQAISKESTISIGFRLKKKLLSSVRAAINNCSGAVFLF